MAVYEYTAKDAAGQIFTGIYEDVSSVSVLKYELEKIGYTLANAKKKKLLNPESIRVKRSEIVAFAYKFAGMCGAGLSIVQCLDTLEKQTDCNALKYVISDIKKNIEAGSSLTDAFNKYRNIFSDFFLGMVEAGESGGRLANSLEISAKHLEKQADLKAKLRNAFTYPIIVLAVCVLIVSALVVFVVPVFSKIYKSLGVSLPGPTQFLFILSVVIRDYWPFIMIAAGAAIFITGWLAKNRYIKTKWDRLKFALPVFGKLNRLVAVASFIRSFAMLIETGVPIIKALSVAAVVAKNEKITEISLDIQKSIQAGNGVSESFEKHTLFPPVIIQLAGSGEQAGILAQMLNKGVEFIDKDIERITASLLVKLEPVLTLGMGAVIGLILMAVYLPMFDYMSHLK